jgi:hypothetical protein
MPGEWEDAMSEESKPASPTAADLAKVIREDSQKEQLTRESLLRERYPGADIPSLLGAAGTEYPDLARIEGKADLYRYSSLSMSEAYATHLARVEDKDPLRLVAETVRDDSRVYPRPTAAKSFLSAPFSLSPSDLASVLLRLEGAEETADIKSCKASNGAVYLYSNRHLTDAHARGLTEYYEVERWQNP